ncbi:hypothetical protein [Kitasatospora griseola]|uniref:hypothetical protein n=1 Tax=Kitasatospora griseola TaxID=2064 RepID=UPI0037F673DB
MSDQQDTTPEITDLGAIPGTETDTERIDLKTIPMTEVKPEDVGTLSLRYVDGVPVLVVSGGKAIPVSLGVVNESGNPVAAYTAGAAPAPTRTALQAASSIGGLILTTEAAVAASPGGKSPGGMPDEMGGLGGMM